MAIDRVAFAESVSGMTAAGTITEDQAKIANILLDIWLERDPQDYRWLAYIMATCAEDPALAQTWNPRGSCEKVVNRMINGDYTGRGVGEFFHDDVSDWAGARAVVDLELADADMVANWAIGFYKALNDASSVSLPQAGAEEYVPPAPPPETEPEKARGKGRRGHEDEPDESDND